MIHRTILASLAIAVLVAAPLIGERLYDIDGPMELHIWLTAKPGEEGAIEKTFREVFYPAVSARAGFRSAMMMRKPGTAEYTVRLSFDSEEQRMEWVASDAHQEAWPALESHAVKASYDGFAIIHPQ